MLIELKNIHKTFEIPGTTKVREVLKNINFQIEAGKSYAITGPSGSGKSTLLNLIGGLDKPNSGSIQFNGTELSSMNENELASFRNQNIGFIFQMHHLLPQLNLIENVLVPQIPQKDKSIKKEGEKRAKELLELVGLSNNFYQLPGQMSGGECQRAAVVRALINQPEIILADEPTGSLDQDNAIQLWDLLMDIQKKYNVALLTVTHAVDLANKMDSIYEIKNGAMNILTK